MTDTNQTPEQSAADTPTAPLPTAPATASVPAAEPPTHPHGIHVHHPVSEGAIVLMIVGALFFGLLSFGVGWHAHVAVTRFQAQHTRMMGQGFGQKGYGSFKGRGGAKMRRNGQCFGQNQGSGLQLPPGHPDITN